MIDRLHDAADLTMIHRQRLAVELPRLCVEAFEPLLRPGIGRPDQENGAVGFNEVDVFYQGVRMTERVKKQEFADMSDEDIDALGFTDMAYEVRPTKQLLKPSDALTLRMLEAYDKRFRSHQEISVQYGGVLQLERPEERTTKIEHTAQVFEEDADNTEQRGGHLALARPAKSSEELDKWAQQGEFAPAPVKFVNAKGEETVLQAPERKPPAAPDPLLKHPRAYDARTLQKPAPPEPPRDGKQRPVQPLDTAGFGRGRPPDGGFKVA